MLPAEKSDSTQIENHNRFLMAVVDTLSEGVFCVDQNGRLLSSNRSGTDMLDGFAAKALLNRDGAAHVYLPDAVTPVSPGDLPLVAALHGRSSTEVEIFIKDPDADSGVWLSVNAWPLRGEGGQPEGAVIVARDVSSQRRLHEQLRSVADEALRSAKLKSEFIANVSHEIRTPLAGVLGMAELLTTREESDDESREIAGYVLQSAQALLSIVNDLLDFSKLEAGKLSIDKDWFSMRDVLQEAARSTQLAATKKGLVLNIGCDERIPTQLLGDRGRLVQVLLNFAHNAIKFTESGTVTLAATLLSETPDVVRIKLLVRDTGIGITPHVLEKLFQPFVQGDGSTTRRYGGTGLGLSIAKQLTELMSGEIGVASEKDKGSEFWISLPFGYRV